MLRTIYLTLGVAFLYVATAQAGILLRPPSLHVTLIWPPSGIALAAVLLYGRQSLPGIFVGGVITTLMILFDVTRLDVLAVGDTTTFSLLWVAVIVSAASTVAVWIAAKLLVLIAPNAPFWNTSSEVISGTFALILACIVYAIGTTGTLYFSGLLPASMTLFIWRIWCVANFIGMLVFAPLVYVIARRWVKPNDSIAVDDAVRPTLFYSLFSLLAFAVFLNLWDSETKRISADLRQQSAEIAESFKQLLLSAQHDLEGIRALLYSSEYVEAREFQQFVSIEMDEHSGGPVALGIGWIPRVSDPQSWRAQLGDQLPTDQFLYELDDTGDHVPVSPRNEYFPVQFLWPLNDTTRIAVGFDLFSAQSWRTSLESARDSGEVTLTVAPIVLVELLSPDPTMLISMAVYRPELPTDTVEARRANLAGFSCGMYLIGPIFERAAARNTARIDFHLFDVTEPGTTRRQHSVLAPGPGETYTGIQASTPTFAQLSTRLNGTAEVEFARHQWLVVASPNPTYVAQHRSYIPWGALFLLLVLGIVLTCILIERLSAQKEVNAERQKTEEALEKAQAANKSRAFLMAAASHDIKQPLLALGFLADTLLMSNPPESTVPLITSLRNSIDQMARHFDTLMDVDKFRAGIFTVTPTTFRLGQFAKRLDLEIAPLCAQKGLAWHLDMDDVAVCTDEDLLLRLFRNLLMNAVQYTESGEISCTAKASADSVEFLVSDTGHGIAPDRQSALFNVFNRLEKEGVGFAGAGLGLAIVAKISDSLNLRLHMSSSENQGTVFRFQLPRVRT